MTNTLVKTSVKLSSGPAAEVSRQCNRLVVKALCGVDMPTYNYTSVVIMYDLQTWSRWQCTFLLVFIMCPLHKSMLIIDCQWIVLFMEEFHCDCFDKYDACLGGFLFIHPFNFARINWNVGFLNGSECITFLCMWVMKVVCARVYVGWRSNGD